MGWNARLYSGEILRERDNIKWDDLNIHLIESLWLDGLEKFKFSKSCIKNFLEFVQFKTARMDSDRNVNIESRSIGWSDGEKEYVLKISEKTYTYGVEKAREFWNEKIKEGYNRVK